MVPTLMDWRSSQLSWKMRTKSTNRVEVGSRSIELEMKTKRLIQLSQIIERLITIETGIAKETNTTEMMILMKRRKKINKDTTRAKVMLVNMEVDLGLEEEEWMIMTTTMTQARWVVVIVEESVELTIDPVIIIRGNEKNIGLIRNWIKEDNWIET